MEIRGLVDYISGSWAANSGEEIKTHPTYDLVLNMIGCGSKFHEERAGVNRVGKKIGDLSLVLYGHLNKEEKNKTYLNQDIVFSQ